MGSDQTAAEKISQTQVKLSVCCITFSTNRLQVYIQRFSLQQVQPGKHSSVLTVRKRNSQCLSNNICNLNQGQDVCIFASVHILGV